MVNVNGCPVSKRNVFLSGKKSVGNNYSITINPCGMKSYVSFYDIRDKLEMILFYVML